MPKVKSNWSTKDIPPQNGKVVIVTGGTRGLGYETALVLAEAGATVILAGRNETNGKEALEKIVSLVPDAKVSFEIVDLASLASVSEFCKRFLNKYEVLDLLINNAGIVGSQSKREETEDGFEMHFATNYLGHFSLTAQLLPALKRSQHRRIVNVSSLTHRNGKINFKDLQAEKRYSNFATYAQSKLCNLVFTQELQRKSDAEGWGLMCLGAHPGYCETDMTLVDYKKAGYLLKSLKIFLLPFIGQSASAGALPILYAASASEVTPGGYYGPNGFYEFKGVPRSAYMNPVAKNSKVAKKLWDLSSSLSNVSWQ